MTLPGCQPHGDALLSKPGRGHAPGPVGAERGLLAETAIYHFGSVSLAAEPCRSATLEAARAAGTRPGATVSFDVNYRPGLWDSERHAKAEITSALALADIVKVNEAELLLLSGTEDPQKGCGRITEKGPALCVATLGPRGSAWATARRPAPCPDSPWRPWMPRDAETRSWRPSWCDPARPRRASPGPGRGEAPSEPQMGNATRSPHRQEERGHERASRFAGRRRAPPGTAAQSPPG